MRTALIILLAVLLAGCATAPRRNASQGPCDSYEYDVVRMAPTSRSATPVPAGAVRHTVRKGETLWHISKQYGVDLNELVIVNDIRDAGAIEKGQIIVIPGNLSTGRVSQPHAARVGNRFARQGPG